MKTNLIIGAGQLGSRHLQGLLKYTANQQQIYVLDPLQLSLDTAAIRADEIPNTHEVHYISDWESLPVEFDLVIIATNADVREEILLKLFQSHKAQFLILEKVLFQSLDSYSRIEELLEKQNVMAWVNHPRRMFEPYQQLKNQLNNAQPKIFQVTGGNWGLGCNGLHFIDLFEFLSGSPIKTIDADWVDSQILVSKRKGFIEFTGSIKGLLNDHSSFQISSLQGEPIAPTITIFDANSRIIIQESGTPQIIRMDKGNGFNPVYIPFTMEFQSSLTARLANDLFSKGSCNLPVYNEAKHAHKLFLNAMLKKYNTLTGLNTEILPIT